MLETSSFTFAGVTIGPDSPFTLTGVDGWFGPPDGDYKATPKPGRFGELVTAMGRRGRTVTLTGECVGRDERDEFMWALGAAAAQQEPVELTGTMAGLTLSASALVKRAAPVVERDTWGVGHFKFSIQFFCPDPRLYGPWVTEKAWISTTPGGVTYPVVYPLLYPAMPPTGQMQLSNPGNVEAPAIWTVTGGGVQRPGVAVAETGARVQYDMVLLPGDQLIIDTADGAGFFNEAYRAPMGWSSLTSELVVPPGVSRAQALGVGIVGTPTIAVAFRPAYL